MQTFQHDDKKLYKRIANINVMMAIQLGMEVNGN